MTTLKSIHIEEFKERVRQRAFSVQKKVETKAPKKSPIMGVASGGVSYVLTDSARNFEKRRPEMTPIGPSNSRTKYTVRLFNMLERCGCGEEMLEAMLVYGVDDIRDFEILKPEDYEILGIDDELRSRLLLGLLLEKTCFVEKYFDVLTDFGVTSIDDIALLGRRDYEDMNMSAGDRYILLFELENLSKLA